jgi:ABC-type glycerol-3-phosphate transport system substrate-binding protein
MSRRRTALAAAVAVGLAGCGGSSSSSSSGSSPAAYRASVNKICAAYNEAVKALPKNTTGSIKGLTTLANSAQTTLAQVKAVTPPSSIAGAVNKWTAILDQSEANVSKLLDAFKSGDTTQLRSLAAAGTKLNAEGNAKAQALGLTSCAQNATPSG